MIPLPSFPLDWRTATIGEFFDVQQGKAMSSRARAGENQKPFLRTANVLWGKLDLSTLDQMSFEDEEADRLALREGDLLTCEGGEVGRTAIWRNQHPGCLHQNHILRLRAKERGTSPEFYMYWLREAFTHLHVYDGAANRTTIPNLSSGRLKGLSVPVPPPEKQRAIASVLSRLDVAVEAQEKIVDQIQDLKSATINKILREGLGNEAPKRTEIGEVPGNWTVVPIGKVFNVQLGKMLSPAARQGGNLMPYLRNKNVRWGGFNLSEVFQMSFSEEEVSKFELVSGDILVCEGGEPGRTAVWNGELPGCLFQKALLRLRPKTSGSVLPRYYLYWATAAFNIFKTHRPTGTQTTIAHIPKERLEAMLMALPPLNEQERIVRILDAIDLRLLASEENLRAREAAFSTCLHEFMTGRILPPQTNARQPSQEGST